MLAYDVTWELRSRWASLLYDDDQPTAHSDPVAPAEPSEAARDKTTTRRNAEGFPIHSFRGLLDTLQGLRRTVLKVARGQAKGTYLYRVTEPDAVQQEALQQAGVKL